MAGAEGLEVASQPLLRCPKLLCGLERRAISTATPTLAPFIRHRRRSQALPSTLRVPRIQNQLYKRKTETDTLRHPFLFLAGAEGLDRKCFAFSLRSATEILANFSTRLTLFAKNSPPDCFLTLRPSRVQVLQTSNRNQKEPQTATLPDFGRGRRT